MASILECGLPKQAPPSPRIQATSNTGSLGRGRGVQVGLDNRQVDLGHGDAHADVVRVDEGLDVVDDPAGHVGVDRPVFADRGAEQHQVPERSIPLTPLRFPGLAVASRGFRGRAVSFPPSSGWHVPVLTPFYARPASTGACASPFGSRASGSSACQVCSAGRAPIHGPRVAAVHPQNLCSYIVFNRVATRAHATAETASARRTSAR